MKHRYLKRCVTCGRNFIFNNTLKEHLNSCYIANNHTIKEDEPKLPENSKYTSQSLEAATEMLNVVLENVFKNTMVIDILNEVVEQTNQILTVKNEIEFQPTDNSDTECTKHKSVCEKLVEIIGGGKDINHTQSNPDSDESSDESDVEEVKEDSNKSDRTKKLNSLYTKKCWGESRPSRNKLQIKNV